MEFFIFSIVHVDINERTVERFEQLKEKGYILATNDILFDDQTFNQYLKIKVNNPQRFFYLSNFIFSIIGVITGSIFLRITEPIASVIPNIGSTSVSLIMDK